VSTDSVSFIRADTSISTQRVICRAFGYVFEKRMIRDHRGRYRRPSPAVTLAWNLAAIAELIKGWRNAPGLELWQRFDGEFRILRYWPGP
jgi:hypothetical protein